MDRTATLPPDLLLVAVHAHISLAHHKDNGQKEGADLQSWSGRYELLLGKPYMVHRLYCFIVRVWQFHVRLD